MKKLIIFGIILIAALGLLLTACGGTTDDGDKEIVRSLRILESSPKSFAIDDDLDLSAIKIEVEYKSGKKEIISLSETMIRDEDRPKFSTIGAGITVLIEYGGRTIPYSFEVTESKQTKYYYAHFVSNGGSSVESQLVSVIETFTIPTKQGYKFLGWYDNVNLGGNPAVAPLPITKETTFFAKWEDNRRWAVEFLDKEGNVIPSYTANIVHGESVLYEPNGLSVEGYIFDRWDGQFDNITENTQIRSIYTRIICFVNYHFNYLEPGASIDSKPVPYGETLSTESRPAFVQKEGFTGKWKILNINYETVEITNQFDRVTSDIDVVPVYEIIKHTLTFQDDSAFLGSGTSRDNIIVTINYGSDFSLTSSENNLSSPEPRVGHTAEWAVLINNQWVCIKNGSIWDELNSEWQPLPVPVTSMDLKNSTGDTVTTITNGTMFSAIKANLQIQAKFVKNKHTLIFRRGQKTLETVLNIPYDTKFKLYKLESGTPDPDLVYGGKPKTYYVNYNAPEDWDIEWYPNNQWEEEDKFDFDNGYITVK
ncbi:MAG: InlB B-repeat-containing protein, partial [Clostridia bacterium]|nr:InlB B-repeat-containing protein [Clostridia bacterium]